MISVIARAFQPVMWWLVALAVIRYIHRQGAWMPHELMNEQQVSAYLRMDLREVVKLASRGQIPCRRTTTRFQFRKGEVDHWVEQHMHTLDRDRLAGIEGGVVAHHGFEADVPIVAPMIPPGGLAVPLHARTRDGVIRDLVALADAAGVVYDPPTVLQQVRQREDTCSTALAPGVALPHPRHPLPYDIAASFVVVGVTAGGIPFGAEDGSLSRLFFLICCKDDRTHLHVLARLAQMLHEPANVDDLIASDSPRQLLSRLRHHEAAVLSHR
jgi:PTS system nitrogen regulatory IIA component